MQQDRRNHFRHDVSIPVCVADDAALWGGITEDISRSGARVRTPALVREGEFIYFSVGAASPDDRAIGWVVREEQLAPEEDREAREIVVAFRQPLPERLESLIDDLDVFNAPLA